MTGTPTLTAPPTATPTPAVTPTAEEWTSPLGTVFHDYSGKIDNAVVYQTFLDVGYGAEVAASLDDVYIYDWGFSHAVTGCDSVNGVYSPANAVIRFNSDSLVAEPHFAVGHEYGHVWMAYYLCKNWAYDWTEYMRQRGILDDPRLNNDPWDDCWVPEMVMATDYYFLFADIPDPGVVVAYGCPYPKADQVPGFRSWVMGTFASP
jgi:hypothetical protein